jgi:N-6 DNA Methylase
MAAPTVHGDASLFGEGGPDAADLIAGVLESVTGDVRRKRQGLHVTPGWLADRLVAEALPGRWSGGAWPTVCDPACGGGAFLLAAARRLQAQGVDRGRIVRELLWGADIDPVGVAATEAALALWAGERPGRGRLVVADPLRTGRSAWDEAPAAGFDAVVGNPPFQSQLGRATARTGPEQRLLRRRFGPAVRAYTDTAWLFLLLGCELVRPGGRVVLIEPQSVVAARDAAAVRAAVDRRAVLRDLWLDDDRVFSAAVRVCAPVLERRREEPSPADARPAGAVGGDRGSGDHGVAVMPGGGSDPWARLWARNLDLPAVELPTGPTLGDRATIVAGFRDQYYGLVAAVREAGTRRPGEGAAPLVTSGALDWAACAWGRRPVRYAKRRWQAPVVDLDRLSAGAPPVARRWVERTRVPKLVVATQTRVVEAAVDDEGTWVPSVPALAVVPTVGEEAGDAAGVGLWHLAAAVLSPAATAWLARRAGGTGLERAALKVAAPDLAALPLPADRSAWDAAAGALAAFASAPADAALAAYLDAIGQAYGTAPALSRWWLQRAGTVVRTAAAGE